MNRFFIDKEDIKGDVVIINHDYNHISHSLRLQTGDKLIVCNGDGFDYLVELTEFKEEQKTVYGQIIEKRLNQNETDVNITLAQAIPKHKNMELVAEKCTELGFKTLIPLETKRTIVKLSDKKKSKRVNRWQRIVKAAAKQSQRGYIPEVKDIYNLEKISKISANFDLVIILWVKENQNTIKKIFADFIKDLNNILILVGPEGGFTDSEVKYIQNKANGIPITLGSRILRTETAGIAVLSILMYELGEFGS